MKSNSDTVSSCLWSLIILVFFSVDHYRWPWFLLIWWQPLKHSCHILWFYLLCNVNIRLSQPIFSCYPNADPKSDRVLLPMHGLTHVQSHWPVSCSNMILCAKVHKQIIDQWLAVHSVRTEYRHASGGNPFNRLFITAACKTAWGQVKWWMPKKQAIFSGQFKCSKFSTIRMAPSLNLLSRLAKATPKTSYPGSTVRKSRNRMA